VINNLEKFGVEFEVNPKIVRGLDYYTGTVFEVFSEKASSAIAAGGRYDLLVEFMGGPQTPALGFAIGVERVVEVLNFQPDKKRLGLFICYTSEGKEKAFDLFVKLVRSFYSSGEEIRREVGDDDLKYHIANRFDISVETSKSLKSQIRYADSQNFRFVAIIGKNEIEKGTITFRDLQNSQQFEMKEDELLF
jgi:histidyl-tRNA synthetase